jgi:hypothetical protein
VVFGRSVLSLPSLLGFLLASSGSYEDELLNFHKWLGWFTALICIWLVVFRQKKSSAQVQWIIALLLSLFIHQCSNAVIGWPLWRPSDPWGRLFDKIHAHWQ